MPQMVENNEDPKMTAFTVTVDVKLGTSTGISAGDRARTLRALANPEVTVVAARTFFASAGIVGVQSWNFYTALGDFHLCF